jgi:hypothetical protein
MNPETKQEIIDLLKFSISVVDRFKGSFFKGDVKSTLVINKAKKILKRLESGEEPADSELMEMSCELAALNEMDFNSN